MNINKLKAIPIAVFCLVASLWSETQGMDNGQDILESSTENAIVRMKLAGYESDGGPIMSDSISPDLAKLKHTQTSWQSYLLSPAKSVIHATSHIITYANAHPIYSAVIIGMIFAGESAMVSALEFPSGECVYTCTREMGVGWKDIIFTPFVNVPATLARCIAACAK